MRYSLSPSTPSATLDASLILAGEKNAIVLSSLNSAGTTIGVTIVLPFSFKSFATPFLSTSAYLSLAEYAKLNILSTGEITSLEL